MYLSLREPINKITLFKKMMIEHMIEQYCVPIIFLFFSHKHCTLCDIAFLSRLEPSYFSNSSITARSYAIALSELHALIKFFPHNFFLRKFSDDQNVNLTNISFFSFFIDNDDELSDWLIEPFVKQELDEGCFEFVTTSIYNQLSPGRRKRQMKITTLVCEECGKNFSRADSLRRHEKLYCKTKSKPSADPQKIAKNWRNSKNMKKSLFPRNYIKSVSRLCVLFN